MGYPLHGWPIFIDAFQRELCRSGLVRDPVDANRGQGRSYGYAIRSLDAIRERFARPRIAPDSGYKSTVAASRF